MDESKYHLLGGELLDEERMSEIKNEVLSGITFETEATTEYATDNEYESGEFVSNEQDTDEIDAEQIVYWTKSGKVWHISRDCRYIKNSTEILCGTVTEAKEAGKEKICSGCEK